MSKQEVQESSSQGQPKTQSAQDLENPQRKFSNMSNVSQNFSEIQFEIGPTSDNFVMIFDELEANQQVLKKEEQNLKNILSDDQQTQQNKKIIKQAVEKRKHEEQNRSKWQKLQNLLKQEQILLDNEKEIFAKKLKKIKHLEQKYYESFLSMQNITSNIQKYFIPPSEHSKLFYNNQNTFVSFIKELRIKPKLLLTLIEKNQLNISSAIRSLPQTLSQSFFQSHLKKGISSDVLIFINKNIEMEINLSNDRQNMLRTDTLPKKIIKEFFNQPKYTKNLEKIFKDTLYEISKLTEDLRLENEIIENESIRRISLRKQSDFSAVVRKKSEFKSAKPNRKKLTVLSSGNEHVESSNCNRAERYQEILRSFDKSRMFRSNTISDQIYSILKIEQQNQRKHVNGKRTKSDPDFEKESLPLFQMQQSGEKQANMFTTSTQLTFPNPKIQQNETETGFSIKIQDDQMQWQKLDRSDSMVIQDRQQWLQDIINLQEWETSEGSVKSDNPQRKTSKNVHQNVLFSSGSQESIQSAPQQLEGSSAQQPTQRQNRGLTLDDKHKQILDKEKEKIIQKKVKKVNKIIQNMLEQLFMNIEIIPNDIRIICALIKYHAQKKYPDLTNAQLYYSLSYFFIDDWVLHIFMKSFNKYQDMDQSKQEILQKNMLYIQSIIKNIMKKQVFKQEGLIARFNSLIFQLGDYVTHYYDQLMNIDMTKILNQIIIPSEQKSLQFQLDFCSVYMSLENIQKMAQLIASNDKDFIQMNETKVVEYAKSINIQAEKIFNDRSDLFYGVTLKKDQIYTIFQFYHTGAQDFFDQYFDIPSLKLPYQRFSQENEFQDSSKYFDKFKNLLRSILVSVEKLEVISQFSGFNDLDITSILKILEDQVCERYNSEIVNVPLVASYLNSMIKNYLNPKYLQNNLQLIWKYMSSEYKARISQLERISFLEKTNNARLIKFLKLNINQVEEVIRKQEKNKRKIYIKEFFDSFQLNVCISSPQSRFKLSNTSKKLYSEFDHSKIWVEDLSCCIHKTANLEFVKDLTGEISPTKKEQIQEHHCENLVQFIEQFSKLPELNLLLQEGRDIWGINEAYSIILDKLEDGVKEYPQFKNLNEEQQNEIIESLFKSINKIFHRNLFPKRQTYKDAAFYILLKSLDFLTPENLEITNNTHSEWIWKICSQILVSMDHKKSPEQKLKCLSECTKVIAEVLKLSSLKDEAASADLTLPNLIYVLIKSKPKRLCSNINFITAFQCKNKMLSEAGYCFIQVQSAIKFIEDLDPSELKEISKQDFYLNLRNEEVKIGIAYMKKRKRNGHSFDAEKYYQTQCQILDLNNNNQLAKNSQSNTNLINVIK
ncbi:vacuolar sorting protein 9, VPS9 domain protein (macronuclear) [Tetrahymena thermophila SB210]|uniref:Vacuolar sorting protein 9, VPS9 domain protein n=1 Tax=Tetrahymena thermophila (strain SB210) TaxID=312017 RepID=Q22RT8_TETTS|nr:vacuolar sorting protein 9, VPS9 domain protein [Tetrahymena thermophila SB210]EAR88034.2 vacuolar sorting protein 9, VPS9 domain protein [Tetrahymena thermophila SB210]|eukprot:XP_001008279.2 vacuolar sorting protein 9, VPS9 domain protein [Tetrahymena thermophila SB210]